MAGEIFFLSLSPMHARLLSAFGFFFFFFSILLLFTLRFDLPLSTKESCDDNVRDKDAVIRFRLKNETFSGTGFGSIYSFGGSWEMLLSNFILNEMLALVR